jgi:guanine deaminase
VSGPSAVEIFRATIFHTPSNAFTDAKALIALADGGLAVEQGRIAGCGDYAQIAAAHPHAEVRDWRGGFIIPGLIDAHVHYPQARILGGIGYSLLDWLDQLTLPEEERFADSAYATDVARGFIAALVSHGTTTAMVFGSHFMEATAALFAAAEANGLRIFSGLVLADRLLRSDLHQTPDRAYRLSKALIARFHGSGHLGYAVTPRFALSSTEGMLEVCQTLLDEDSTLRFTTHINENVREVEEVARLFPWANDYLGVYERFGLIGRRSVLAHNVHASEAEIGRLAGHGAAIAHCPSSNAALGSGIFSMKRHIRHGVCCALGTDVGGGTGFGMLKEALQAYLMQRVALEPVTLSAAQMLYLATRAGAEALGLNDETGDFNPGKAADFVYLQPPAGGILASVVDRAQSLERVLPALVMLAGTESIREIRVEGEVVFANDAR